MAVIDTRVYSTEAALLRAQPETKISATVQYGALRYMAASYTIPTADELGTDCVVEFFTLPKNARVIDAFISAAVDGGTTGQMKIGWAASLEEDENGTALVLADDDGFFLGTDADWGAGALSRVVMKNTEAGFRKKFAAAVVVQGDVVEATTDSGANTLLLEMYFIVE